MSPRLELWQLRYFVAVAQELSFRRAAERLSITQPPLTRQIQALEDTVGARLFERTHSGVTLTSAGRYLLDEARGLLSSADTLVDGMRERFQRRVELRLGITTVVDPALFTWLEPALKRRAPGVSLVQKRQISQRSIADLRKRVLDAALIGLPSSTSELTIERLHEEPLVAAIPRGHWLARRKRISLLDLREDPLFWFPRQLNAAYFDHFEAVFRKLGFDPPRLPEPADHHVLLGLIAAGQGFALVPSSLTSITRAGVLYKHLEEHADLRLGIAVAYRSELPGPQLGLLLETLRAHYRISH
jgi:DNA-binding transcriptional LysR family regulator